MTNRDTWTRRTFGQALLAAGVLPWVMPAPARAGTGGTIRGVVRIRIPTRVKHRRGHPPKFKFRDKRNRSDVVVYLEGVRGSVPDTTNMIHEIRQVDRQFTPEVSVVLKGSTVSFPNDDKVFHNVYSNSDAAGFDLGQYKSGTTETVVVKKTGVVEVYCNIHRDMAAHVLVLDTVHFVKTGRKGMFELRNVPPGTHRITAWQRYGRSVQTTVTVKAGQVTMKAFELLQGSRKSHRRKKDGSAH